MSSNPTDDARIQTARTAGYSVLAASPGLALAVFAAASSSSLTIKADLALTLLDMIALTSAWALARRAARAGSCSTSARAELFVALVVALCMGISVMTVAGIAAQRLLTGGMAAEGPGVVLGAALNVGYGLINCWMLRRWKLRGGLRPDAFVRSQICLFSDKLSSNVLIALSLGASILLEGTTIARFIDPVTGLLVAAATARWMLPVLSSITRAWRLQIRGRRRLGRAARA